MTHINMIEDPRGNLVDVEYFCSALCYTNSTGNVAYGHAWPGGSETNSDVHCHNCSDLMWHGLETL